MKTLPTKVEYSAEDYKKLTEEFKILEKEKEQLLEANAGFKNFIQTLSQVVTLNIHNDTNLSKELEIFIGAGGLQKIGINVKNKY